MKYRSSIFSILLFIASPPLFADDLPDAPTPKTDAVRIEPPKRESIHKFNKKVFYTGVGLMAAVQTADAITTRQVLNIGGSEKNHLFGTHPGVGTQAGINLGIFAARSTVFYFTEKSSHRWIHWTGRTALGMAIVNHTSLAACGADIAGGGRPTCHAPFPVPW